MRFLFIALFLFLTSLHASNNTLNVALYGLDKKVASDKTVKKLLLKLFSKVDYLKDKKINTFFYKKELDLINDLKSSNKKFDLLFTLPSLYLHYYDAFEENSKNPIALSLDDDKFIQYYLISNKQNKINSVLDMKNKKVVVQSADLLSQIWLESLFYKKGLNYNKKKIILNKTQNYRMYKKVLDVYFNKIDLGIISSYTWQTSVDLNPSIKSKVKIIKKSKKIFPPVISVAHKNIDEKVLKSFNDYIFNEENSEYVSNILSIVKVNRFDKINKNDYKEAIKFYKEYLSLKRKYN